VALLNQASAEDTTPAPAARPRLAFSIGMDGPIVINPTPYVVKSGAFGDITINGAVTGLAFAQNHHVGGDHSGVGGVTNAQVLIEKTDGMFQFFIDAGTSNT
jgi:hypothetical protein